MTDVNSRATANRSLGPAPVPHDRPSEHERAHLVAMVELLFFAYRGFVSGPDQILSELGFGRAHHRVLHFVNRNPGLRVADLLGILKITKQSLARVLKQLVDRGYIGQTTGDSDRRERRLRLSEKGRILADRLLELQMAQLEAAVISAGPGAERTAAAFLAGVVNGEDRETAAALFERATGMRKAVGAAGGREPERTRE